MPTLVAQEEIKKARKRHQCDWCGEDIEEGSSYIRQRVVDCRDAWVWKAHPECSKAASTLSDYDLECIANLTMARGCTHDRFETCERCMADNQEKVLRTFFRDTKDHTMKVIKDDGVYRNIEFSNNGSSIYKYSLITWPGYLAIVGDMGDLVFKRLEDMFEFFGGHNLKPENPSVARINPGYWAQKLVAKDEDPMEFDEEKAKAFVEAYLEESEISDEEEKGDFREGINYKNIEIFTDSFYDAICLADKDYYPDDIYGCVRSYTMHYLWKLFAIQYGIYLYKEHRKKS